MITKWTKFGNYTKQYKSYNYNMSKRVTIVLDDDLAKKLREKQAKQIKESTKSVSFSKVLNETVRIGLKKAQKKLVKILGIHNIALLVKFT